MFTTNIQKIHSGLKTTLSTTADFTFSKVTQLTKFIFESGSIGLNFIIENPLFLTMPICFAILIKNTPFPYNIFIAAIGLIFIKLLRVREDYQQSPARVSERKQSHLKLIHCEQQGDANSKSSSKLEICLGNIKKIITPDIKARERELS